MNPDATFEIYHNGKFSVSSSGIVTYDGGEIHKLESQPESMLENLVDSLKLSLSEHRIWYKLPFERLSDLKMMCSGTDGFERMCVAANYTKAIDIFLEKNVEKEGDINGNRGDDNIADDDNVREDAEDAVNHYKTSGEDDENVECCGDDDEVYNSEGTPPNSDCEGERQYVRCKKGSGEIRIGQVFDSRPHFKEAVVDYALKEGVNVKFSRWGSEKCEVKCSLGRTCKFRIYSSIQESIGKYVVKTFYDEHSCIPDGYCKVVKDGIIAKLFLNDIRKKSIAQAEGATRK